LETQLEIDQFLMFELADVCGLIENQELRAYAIGLTIGAAGDEICESWLKIYLSSCAVNKEQMDIHIAVFNGMELITITCDCDDELSCMKVRFHGHPGYALGQTYKEHKTPEYLDARARFDSLRQDLVL
jgi:hypothetical protein